MKHFKLTDEKISLNGKTLYRIECTKDFQYAKKGDKGGFIEKEENLADDAWVYGNACVSDYACVSGNAYVYGYAKVHGYAEVASNNDFCSFTNFGSKCRTTTAFKQKDGSVMISCGCFNGSIDEFLTQVEDTHSDNKYAKEYKAIVEVIKIKFNL